MSIFKEKDDYITNALKNQFDYDSDEDESDDGDGKISEINNTNTSTKEAEHESECHDVTSSDKVVKKPKLAIQDCISLSNDDDSDDDCIVIDDKEIAESDRQNNHFYTSLDSSTYITLDEGACKKVPDGNHKQDATGDQSESIGTILPPQVNESQEDYDFTLHLNITGTHRKFQTTYNTPLCDALRDVLNELEACNKTLIITSKTSSSISFDATPKSLNLQPGSILEAIEVASSLGTSKVSSSTVNPPNPDEIRVKMQDGNLRHQRELKTSINDPLIKLKEAYAKDLNIESIENIKLYFDGDRIADEMTPGELGMEDGDAIDVVISN